MFCRKISFLMRPANGTAFRENPTFYQQNLKLENTSIKARQGRRRGKAAKREKQKKTDKRIDKKP